ncbi:MAG: hypothetical protein ACLVFV_09035 [Clostridium sp.]
MKMLKNRSTDNANTAIIATSVKIKLFSSGSGSLRLLLPLAFVSAFPALFPVFLSVLEDVPFFPEDAPLLLLFFARDLGPSDVSCFFLLVPATYLSLQIFLLIR